MKKLIGLIIIMIGMLIMLAGCVEVNYEVQVNKDGSGDVTYIYGILKDYLTRLNVSAEDLVSTMMEQAEDSSYTVEAYEDSRISGFKAYKHIDNLEEEFSLQEVFGEEYVQDTEDNGIKVEKGLFVTKYSQKTDIDLSSMSELNLSSMGGSDEAVKMIYKIKLPAQSKSNNATTVSNNKKELTWELVVGEVNTIEFEAVKLNILSILIIIATLIIVIIIANVVRRVILKRKNVTKM